MELEEIIKKVNEMQFMEYDITMCYNNDCPRKEECHRYIMCQAYKADTRKDKPRFLTMYKGNSESCNLFWKHKK